MSPGTARRVVVATVLTLVVALGGAGLAGCALQVTGPSLVLQLATPDPATDPTGVQVQHFIDEVAARSGGTIRIDPVWDVTPNGAVGWDQTVAHGVAAGTWDMGLVAGRAWDELGVTSLRALSAPFLLTNETALEAVLDSDLRDRLLSGLPAAGVVGVDLFPDELRHPFGYGKPLLGPDDYDGQMIWSARSATVTRVLAALGARTTDGNADVEGNGQRGAEGAYALARAQIATGNVTFFPKTDSLVMRTAVRDRLRDDQWALLRDAAAATRRWLDTHEATDQEDAAEFCAKGGTIVAASRHQLVALRRSTAPVVSWLRRDADTRSLLDDIADLVRGIDGPTPVTSCPQQPRPEAADAELASLDGTYVARVTPQQLRGAGERDPHLLQENSGRYTWVLSGGTFIQHQTARHFVENPDITGTYTYRDGVLTLHWPFSPPETTTARLSVGGRGGITFHDIHDSDPQFQVLSEGVFGSPWTRIGGVPG